MNIASVVVVFILLWCFFFFISLPFGVQREEHSVHNFGGIRQPNLWFKVIFATIMTLIFTAVFFWVQSSEILPKLFS